MVKEMLMTALPHVSAYGRPSGVFTTVLITLLAIIQPAPPLAQAAPAQLARPAGARVSRPQPDDALLTRAGAADPDLVTALDKLSVARRGGEPFAIQEIEILDAWEAGLPIAGVEAEILVSRAIYHVYVAGRLPAQPVEGSLIDRWRSYILAHALDLQSRNLKLNDGLHQKVRPPDGSREWELYSDPALFNQLSSAYQRRLEAIYGRKGKVRRGVGGGATESPASPEVAPPNTLVNNPAADATAQDTQSETALVLGSGSTILSSFNDSGSFVGGAPKFTGVARSTDSGATFTDNGALPNSAQGDAGDPVLARSNSSGTAILATLGFNSAAVLQMFRTLNDGATYLAPVDGDGGGTSNDKEWVASDNFAGSGQGNFYLYYRDFGGGGGMSFTRSTDDGATWSARQILAGNSGQGAWVTVGANHAVYAFWLTDSNVLALRKSTDQGVTFGAQTNVTTLNTAGINGDLGLGGGFRTNAFPQVVTNPVDANQLYMTWNDKPPSGPDKANIYFSQSTDAGATWSAPLQVNADAGTNDNWMPCIAITPDGSGLFVSWYDRRLDAANSLIDVFGRNATISGTSVTFGNDYRITDASFPVVIGQDPVVNAVYMGDYDTAVADNTDFHRTWGDNRLPLGSHAHQPDVRYTKVPKAGPGAIMTAGATAVLAESCSPPNGAPDPGEIVTVSFGVVNSGTAATTNLVGTLQATGGVTNPSPPATYGVVAPGASASQNFTFTANGSCGGTITASLQLQDGATDLGTVTYDFTLGTTTLQTFSNPANITINDNLPATPYPSNITVSGVAAYSRVTVTLTGLSHTFPADIDIIVVAPGGQDAYVMSDVGGGGDVVGVNLTFDDTAAAPLGGGQITSGTYKPSELDSASDAFPAPAPPGPYSLDFSVFNGLGGAANGTWSLYVRDDLGADFGNISGGWSISFVSPQCSTSCVPVELQSFDVQ
jgi:subtilisin-like proprotein convertase family protein